ncbi:MAG: FKBP-type peptidyl-prolyl cis-trans isomerase, partial [Bacteroidetes bacterium]
MLVALCVVQQAVSQELKTPKDSLSYAVGVLLAKVLVSQGVADVNLDLVHQGMQAALNDEPTLFSANEANQIVQDYAVAQQQRLLEANKAAGEQFLAENAKRPGVVTLPSGLQYEVLQEGDGPSPTEDDEVTVHYHGTLIDGTVFDSSVERGEPATFPVSGVIPGWVEALQLMKVGSKWKLYIPAELAYGERGAGGAIGP